MRQVKPFVITISRQPGSGGAYLGRRLAARLKILYLDREIVYQAAKELEMSEQDLESRDEKLTPLWKSLLESAAYIGFNPYVPPALDIHTDQELYAIESDIIKRTAQRHSVVIVGRGGSYVLCQHPRHLSVFLHADMAFRQRLMQELNNISEEEALKRIPSLDRERARYLHALTGRDWTDARQYHLSIDTGVIGLETAENIILAAIHARFDDIELPR